jgi:CubicO group peptidase (beta-lactamase class C family)
MKTKNRFTLLAITLFILGFLPAANAKEGDVAQPFITYWNTGATRAEQNEKVFTADFIARRTPAGLALIMNMVYGDNGDITIHTIHSSSSEKIQFLVSTEKGNWLDVGLSFSADQKVAGMDIGFTDAPPQKSDKGMNAEQIAGELQRYADELAAKGEFAGSIILAKDGKPLFAKAYGQADRETGRENTLDTPINLGSMNKMFTGLAITQLVAQGKLAYSDTVGQYLPDYAKQRVRDEVTVHQLLTHTSGLGSYWNEAYTSNKKSLSSVSDFAELFVDDPLQFDPGSDEEYSNAGPVVLGLIIEAISGQDYYEYIRTNIYQPAGMTHSGHFDKFENVSGKASGYFVPRNGNELISNQQDLGRIGSPAGGGYASANDLLKFATALYDGSLIDADHREQMTSKKIPGANGGGYAYLYHDGRINEKRFVGHNGGAPGINAEFSVFPDSGYTIIVLANLGHAASPVASQIRQWVGYASD